MWDLEQMDTHLDKIGKYKMGKLCLYVNKLEDIDVLKSLIRDSVKFVMDKYR